MMRVERMRQAIMENISVEFAKPLLPTASLYSNYPYGPYPVPPGVPYRPAGAARMAYPIAVRGGRGGPPVPVGMGPKTPGRGRGILGNCEQILQEVSEEFSFIDNLIFCV